MFENNSALELQQRYKMDPEVWERSKRDSFPFNISLGYIVLTSVALPVITYLIPIGYSKFGEY